jgi:hypothetical protein
LIKGQIQTTVAKIIKSNYFHYCNYSSVNPNVARAVVGVRSDQGPCACGCVRVRWCPAPDVERDKHQFEARGRTGRLSARSSDSARKISCSGKWEQNSDDPASPPTNGDRVRGSPRWLAVDLAPASRRGGNVRVSKPDKDSFVRERKRCAEERPREPAWRVYASGTQVRLTFRDESLGRPAPD